MINQKMKALGTTRSKIRELFEYGKALAEKIGKENVFDFTLGNPSVECPAVVNDFIAETVKKDAFAAHSYTSSQGDKKTREAVCAYNLKKYGFALDPDLVYMTCGAAAALRITFQAIISSEKDEIIALVPYFPEYKVFAEGAGAIFKEAACDKEFKPDFKDLESKITKNTRAVIINSPNNPSGAVYNEKDVLAIAELLKRKEKEYGETIYLVSDEPYREIVFDGEGCPFIPAYYDDTVICYSYSKALSVPGERIGYVAVSPKAAYAQDLTYAVNGAGRSLGYVCAPSLFQKVVANFAGEVADINPYKENRDYLVEMLNGLGFTCANPKGAFYLFMKSPVEDAEEFSEKAKTFGILVVPSDTFGMKGYVRIATCVSEETVKRSEKAFTALAGEYFGKK